MPSWRGFVFLLVIYLAGCSGPAADPSVFASGTARWGSRPDQSIAWEVQEASGLTHSLILATKSGGASVSRQGQADLVWLAGTIPSPDAPTIVFGGVSNEIDSLLLVTAGGEQIELELVPAADREWSVVVGELPSKWATSGVFSVEVVASRDGSEVVRETLQSIGG